ncbi:MAG: MraY family glycosyltransferase [Tepidisphaeraceae bacterium]|jgi:UDP-GlcNAc:undecaprenyl-phosphate GlcNAc-1-phosphate transferase
MQTVALPSNPVPEVTWDSVLGPHVWVFYTAFLIAFIFTPVMQSIAMYYNIVDQPDRLRKLHSQPVAYLGGVAVFIGWVAGLAMSQFHLPEDGIGVSHLEVKLSIVAGGGLICILGLWDDLRRLRPIYKITGQIVAALILLSQGVGLHSLSPVIEPLIPRLATVTGVHLSVSHGVVEVFSAVFVVLVVVGCCNATNLLDGLDGLCGGVTAVIAAGFLFLAVHLATVYTTNELDPLSELNPVRIVLALALLGAVLGFVPFNFNPASIFMGDTGSMFLGYACATMIVSLAEENAKWLLAAMVMFALPILDTTLAFARRWVNRRPLFSADRHHFHHQLVDRGYSVRKTVLISYGLAFGFCFLGTLIAYMRTRYAVAFYLVTFGSIIVAAYKMGMVHEKPRVVSRMPLGVSNSVVDASVPPVPGDVLDLQPPATTTANQAKPNPRPDTAGPSDIAGVMGK